VLDIVLFSIPEAIVVAGLVNTLSGTRLPWHKLAAVGVLTGIVSAVMRPYTTYFSVHMTAYILIFTASFVLFSKTEKWKLLVSVAIALTIYLIIEYFSFYYVVRWFALNTENYDMNICTKVASFLPQLATVYLIGCLLKRKEISLFGNIHEEGDV